VRVDCVDSVSPVRRSIDDYPFQEQDLPPGADDAARLSWAVAITDDYDDGEPS